MDKSLLESSLNTRDLGGYPTADGRRTRPDVVWRSDAPAHPTARDIQLLLRRGITTIIDLRTPAEVEKAPEELAGAPGFHYGHFPITEGSVPPPTLEDVPQSYLHIAGSDQMPGVFRFLAEADGGALVHCTAGKDRTGVVSAILLLLCQVERDVIIRDYAVSREYNKARLEQFLARHPEVDRRVVLANEVSMDRFITLFENRYGSAAQYLAALGLTPDQIRAIRTKLLGA
ncbi:MAG: tyrosine-protein phosphatase [Clostridia bacterium]|nr:tyrosine-protein phosphatase [Clostridia bacterium]